MINLITDAVRARGTAARFTKDTPPARFMWMPAATHTIAAAFTGVVTPCAKDSTM